MRRSLLNVALMTGSLACGLDASALGTDSGVVVASDGSESMAVASSGDDPTAADGTGSGTSGGGSTSAVSGMESGPDPTTGDTGDDGSSDSTGAMVDPCANPAATILMNADSASLDAPMQLGNVGGVGPYVYSEQDSGQAHFAFHVSCQAEFRVYGRVYDAGVGLTAGIMHSDSFRVAFDDDPPEDWLYGCQTFDAAVGGYVWEWELVKSHVACIEEDFRRTLSPGTHVLHVLNVEGGMHQQGIGTDIGTVAALASVAITSDPAYSP
ncbi:MAG: hypothetical protein KDK70_04180 [Myxococcales bacterium]|nr:hypothetical protein [Myxococcales bacterium]